MSKFRPSINCHPADRRPTKGVFRLFRSQKDYEILHDKGSAKSEGCSVYGSEFEKSLNQDYKNAIKIIKVTLQLK